MPIHFLHLMRWDRLPRTDTLAALALTFALVAALACDEDALTETRAPAGPAQGTQVESPSAVQGDVSTMAIGLPVNQSVATTTPNPAFRILQTGTGPHADFQITNAVNSNPVLMSVSRGVGAAGLFQNVNGLSKAAVLGALGQGLGPAVFGYATGAGSAGQFEIPRPTNSSPALLVKVAGTGNAGLFESSNTLNISPALRVRVNGSGRAGQFEIGNTANAQHALQAQTNGSGVAVAGLAIGARGGAAWFVNNTTTNPRTALEVRTDGTGNAGRFWVSNSAGGHAIDALSASQVAPALKVTGMHSAAQFYGDVNVEGNLRKYAGSFRIDHPLDPEHKYLSHSFVESPDMMNVYNGNVTLDSNGRATVELPDYFEALNRDFRYQLTAIGAPGPNLYVAEGVKQNEFRIAGGRPYARVSWQVTGVRQDTYAEQHRIRVEENKPAAGELVAGR